MKKYTKEKIDDMREMLANSPWAGAEDMTDEQIIDQYENVYGELEN